VQSATKLNSACPRGELEVETTLCHEIRQSHQAVVIDNVAEDATSHAPSDAMERLFQPFYRVSARDSRQGLGLGLYIASEIACAHGGTIGVRSLPEETSYMFRMLDEIAIGKLRLTRWRRPFGSIDRLTL
jgi:K+-sensing histidine kinase KdpD